MRIINVNKFLEKIGFEKSHSNKISVTFTKKINGKELKAVIYNQDYITHIIKNGEICDFKEVLYKNNLISKTYYNLLCMIEQLDPIANIESSSFYMIAEEIIYYMNERNPLTNEYIFNEDEVINITEQIQFFLEENYLHIQK